METRRKKARSLSLEALVALNDSSRKALLGIMTLWNREMVVPNSCYWDSVLRRDRSKRLFHIRVYERMRGNVGQ